MTLESDKATMDVPSPAAGKITADCRQGRRQSLDGLADREARRGRIEPRRSPSDQEDEADAKEEEDAAEAPDTSPVAPSDLPPRPPKAGAGPALADFSGVFAGPAVRRLARELGLDLNQIKGTGEKGRITREDVKAALARGGAAPRPRQAAARCPRSRRSTSPNSGRSRPFRYRASRRSPARGSTPPGSTFRMSPTATKPTSPISTPSERLSTKTRRKTNQSLIACRCCRFSCERQSPH